MGDFARSSTDADAGPPLRVSLALLTIAALAAAPLLSRNPAADQAGTSTTLKIASRIVVVDVVVPDGKGQAVGGLQKKHFHITEDGKAQSITSFEEHKASHAAPVKLPPMPPNVFSNFPTTKLADSGNVVLFDSLHTQSRDQSYMREQLEPDSAGIEDPRSGLGGWATSFMKRSTGRLESLSANRRF